MSRWKASALGATILIVTALGAAEARSLPGDAGTAPDRGDRFIQLAQANPSQLPGGATSLREAHGDWIVACNAQAKAKSCTVSQQHTDNRSGQRVLAIEISAPAADGGARATLVLPFGLQLDKGVVPHIDEAAATAALAFRTCLPAGCVVETTLTRQTLDAWRKGTSLKLKTFAADTGGEAPLTISLKGLAQAMDRAAALAK
jgi:invasion protein IalB